jgi:hypothetical protein
VGSKSAHARFVYNVATARATPTTILHTWKRGLRHSKCGVLNWKNSRLKDPEKYAFKSIAALVLIHDIQGYERAVAKFQEIQ